MADNGRGTTKDQDYYDNLAAELTRSARHAMRAFDFPGEAIPDEFLKPDRAKGVPAPSLEKEAPANAVRVALAPVDDLDLGQMPLVDTLKRRRSRRAFTLEALTQAELAFLCWSVAGVHRLGPDNQWSMRSAPSGGARHPFETYLIVERVEGLDPGIYRYSGLRHDLVQVRAGAGICSQLGEEALQAFVKSAAVLFVWTAVPYRNEWKYMFTGAKQMAMDLGHYCQNLYLAAESIGAGTCAIAAYRQELLDEALGVDGEDEFTMYVAPVGKVDST